MFAWVKGNAYAMVATLYRGNITLNAAAAQLFQDIRWVMVGIDHQQKRIAIKPVTKNELDLKLVPITQLHKLSIGKGYARVTNKELMQEIFSLLEQDEVGCKFYADFDDDQNILIIDLQKQKL